MKRTRAAVLGLGVLALGLGGIGCRKYPACKKSSDCRAEAGETCVDGSCQNCAVDADCVARTPPGEAPWICNALRCSPADAAAVTPGAGGALGDPCSGGDCQAGLVCREGTCSACTADLDCSPSTCDLGTGRCLPNGACNTDDECAMDEICDGGMCVFSGLGEEGGGPCGLSAVYFGFDSDALTPRTEEELSTVAECVAQQGQKVYLEAHADDRGTEEYNILLTERRGLKVRSFLAERGVPMELMQVIAKGSLEASGTDEPSRAEDRRVAFIWDP